MSELLISLDIQREKSLKNTNMMSKLGVKIVLSLVQILLRLYNSQQKLTVKLNSNTNELVEYTFLYFSLWQSYWQY